MGKHILKIKEIYAESQLKIKDSQILICNTHINFMIHILQMVCILVPLINIHIYRMELVANIKFCPL